MGHPNSREVEKMEREGNQEAKKKIKRLRYHKKAQMLYEEHQKQKEVDMIYKALQKKIRRKHYLNKNYSA